jgi:hypothetical protein
MNYKTVSALIICTYSYACTDSHKVASDNEWNEKIVSLQGQVISPIDINVSREIKIIDSLMIIEDANEEPIYHIFKITDENKIEYVSKFGNRGNGPNEFIYNLNIQIGEGIITIPDKSLSRNYVIDSHSLLKDTIPIITESLRDISNYNNFIKLKDGLYVGNGRFIDGMFAFYLNDSIINTKIPYPNDGIPADNLQKGMVYQGLLVKHPKKNRLVYAGYYGHILEIYEVTSDTAMHKIFSDIYEYPLYEGKNSPNYLTANFKDKNRIGFFSISVSQEYIYALYCGRRNNEKNTEDANIVYVYNWDGGKIKKYILDKNIVGISVDKHDKRIYSLYNDPEDDILKVLCFNM